MITNTINKKMTANQAYCLSECFAAYAMYCPNEPIYEFGYNLETKFAYIALKNGIQIIKSHNTWIQYLAIDNEGNEIKYGQYDKCQEFYSSYESKIDIETMEFNGTGLSMMNYEY